MSDVPTVTLADIVAARELLEDVTVTTPMEESRWLSALVGGRVSLKCENLQRTGSFKSRGAYVRIAGLSADERAHGVVAASAGNHAQGVALAATTLGIASTVFMPEGAPIPKEKATRGYGADVVFHGRYLEDALVAARAFAEETGAVLLHPFDHVDIVAGQGTLGLEVLEQAPDVRTVLVPTGGGGLLAGVATVVGLAILVYRRRTVGPVFSATTVMDKVMYAFLVVAILLGMWNTVAGSILTIGGEYNYREGVSVWFRSFLAFQPDADLMAEAPLGFQLHALVAFGLFALWPFTRLVHVFSAPLGYLTRPYIVYRSRDDDQLGSHRPRRGWDRVGGGV